LLEATSEILTDVIAKTTTPYTKQKQILAAIGAPVPAQHAM